MRRSVVALGQNGKKCRLQGKDLISILKKKHHYDQIVEASKKYMIQNTMKSKKANILVGMDRLKKTNSKIVTNTTADTVIRFIKNT